MPRPSALLAAAKPRHAASSVARALTSTRARHLPWRAFRAPEARGRHWTGQSAERRVRRHFLLRGYRVLATNAWAGGNELDLVVRRGRQLIFCEVKAKTGDRFGHPWEAVTPEKERRVRRAVDAWLAARPELADLDVELEAVAVRGRRIERAPIG